VVFFEHERQHQQKQRSSLLHVSQRREEEQAPNPKGPPSSRAKTRQRIVRV